jgi:hypothetical protein
MNAKTQRLEAKDAERGAGNTKRKTEMEIQRNATAAGELKFFVKAQRNVMTAGKLEFFVDGRTLCPDGMAEVNATKGMVLLLGRPDRRSS